LGDILVVAPYNLQLNALKAALPPEARVGTIDTFLGQEAPVCLVSMAHPRMKSRGVWTFSLVSIAST
jgi:hypothetical protein